MRVHRYPIALRTTLGSSQRMRSAIGLLHIVSKYSQEAIAASCCGPCRLTCAMCVCASPLSGRSALPGGFQLHSLLTPIALGIGCNPGGSQQPCLTLGALHTAT